MKYLTYMKFYTEQSLRKDLEQAEIENYSLDRLQYSGWSFFLVICYKQED